MSWTKLSAEDATCPYQTPLYNERERPRLPAVDLLYLPNFARLEKFYYVHAFQYYLPSLQRPPFPGGVRSSLSSSFEDLTFLTMTDKLVFGYILWHTLSHSRQLHDFDNHT